MERTRGLWGWSRWLKGWSKLPVPGAPGGKVDVLLTARRGMDAEMSRQVLSREKALRQDHDPIEWRDFGAGCPPGGTLRQSRISELAQRAASDPRKGRWLMAAARAAAPSSQAALRILELGTCLGSGADYLMAGAPAGAEYVGLEGSPALADRTAARLEEHRLAGKQAEVRPGPFSATLPALVKEDRPFDLFFLDGLHEGDRLREQWQQLEPLMAPNAVAVIDDIRWSRSMHEAWSQLATCSGWAAIDLFRMGILARCNGGDWKAERPHTGTTWRSPWLLRA